METEHVPGDLEAFLLHNRPFCEVGTCMKPSVRISSLHNKPVAMCEKHWQEQGIEQ